MTVPQLADKRRRGEPIVMVTAYDFPSAQVAEQAGVDMVLVGDSAAMTVLGYASTVPVTVDEMMMLASAVRRGLRTPLLVGDLPFGSYEGSDEQAIATAQRFVKEAGCDAVKLEMAAATSVQRARAIVARASRCWATSASRRRPRPRSAATAPRAAPPSARSTVADDALALQEAGCFAIVFEAIPAAVSELVMARMEVPVIGIGAGPATDGQVLVFHDLLGIYEGLARASPSATPSSSARWSRASAPTPTRSAPGASPTEEHSYSIDPEELERFRTAL